MHGNIHGIAHMQMSHFQKSLVHDEPLRIADLRDDLDHGCKTMFYVLGAQ